MLTRRVLLKGVLVTPVAFVANRLAAVPTDPPFTDDYGVASGDPQPDRVVLWTRVPEAVQPPFGEVVVVSYQVATAADFPPGSIAAEGELQTSGSADYTVKVIADGLASATPYFYRFWADTGYQSVVGQTKTVPMPDAHPQAISFAFVSCQNFTQGFYSVYAHLAREQVDFCVHLGDNIYEVGHVGLKHGYVREDDIGDGQAADLDTYRQKYQLYLSDPHLREVRRRFPWIVLWDDRELNQ